MKNVLFLALFVTAMGLMVPFVHAAETTVTLKGVHLCCGGCSKGVERAVKQVDGATVKCDRKAGTAVITAGDKASAQKALDVIADAGYHGKTDSSDLRVKDDNTAPDRDVSSLTVTGAHLCCGSCVKGVNKAVKGVAGVAGTDAKKKQTSFTIKGTFNAKAAVKALYEAGYHVKVAE